MAGFERCGDESCMGVIGPDGRCTECGAGRSDPAEDGDEGREDREPCPDGACIGVAGPDGLCTECGRRVTKGGTGGPLRASAAPAEREPCPDGTCIGLIGEDGRCTECGLGAEAASFEDDEDEEEDEDWGDDGADPDDRLPCPDGGCIGIIGEDGRCTECGRRSS